MSYHILHQFDEQWLADLRAHDGKDKGKSFISSFDDRRERKRRARFGSREGHYWGVIAAAILMATFALLFALDASHRAEILQQRLDAVERTVSIK
ncbi:MAG TPA: hypothetical protein VKB86_06045 [Pyrinomonadaceae bacterium]|nr:hypothetical protein [Pyrinomonadaceae bacterium]